MSKAVWTIYLGSALWPLNPTLHPEMNDIETAHALYCQLTGQKLSLRFDRLRLWHDLFKAGFTAADLQTVVKYLQREIRAKRRNVGALKLSNLLQLDRFEEDLNITRVRLNSPHPQSAPLHKPIAPTPISPLEVKRLRQSAKIQLQSFREQLARSSSS